MKRFIAFFSYLFHPLFISVYATLFYFIVTRNFFYQHEIYLVFLQVLILTILLPISLIYLLESLGLIKSKLIINKRERKLPLAIHAVLLFVLIKHSFSVLIIPELYYFFLGNLISTLLILTLLLFNFKASIHMAGISALTIFIISISAYYHVHFLNLIAFLIICNGFVASSRLQSKNHNFVEISLGLLIGIMPQIGLWYTWLIP